jgi:hypothetical protein
LENLKRENQANGSKFQQETSVNASQKGSNNPPETILPHNQQIDSSIDICNKGRKIKYEMIPSNTQISTPFFQKTVFFSNIFFGKPPFKIFGGMSKL